MWATPSEAKDERESSGKAWANRGPLLRFVYNCPYISLYFSGMHHTSLYVCRKGWQNNVAQGMEDLWPYVLKVMLSVCLKL